MTGATLRKAQSGRTADGLNMGGNDSRGYVAADMNGGRSGLRERRTERRAGEVSCGVEQPESGVGGSRK